MGKAGTLKDTVKVGESSIAQSSALLPASTEVAMSSRVDLGLPEEGAAPAPASSLP